MKLFEFIPDETGYNSFYIMSESEDEALEGLCMLEENTGMKEPFSMNYWNLIKHKYIIKTYGINEPTWTDNC